MRSEETRVLPDNVHDIGRDNGLVVLSPFLLTQAQQFLQKMSEIKHCHIDIPHKSMLSWFEITLMTVTRKRISSSSCIAPLIDPIAQQSVFKFFHDHSAPSTCRWSFSVMILSVSTVSK